MQMTTPARLRYRRVPAPPGMSGYTRRPAVNGMGIWSTLATAGSTLLNTGATLYQTQQTTEAAKAASKADIEAAKAGLALAQTEMEQARLQQEIAVMEAQNRREFIKDVAPMAIGTILVGAGAIYFLRKKKGRR